MPDMSYYKGKRIFVTGHTGFKGSWLCRMLITEGAEVTGYALAPDSEENLFDISGCGQYMNSVIGDVRDAEGLMRAYVSCRPDIVIHMAAQPLVRYSYEHPVYTYDTNVMGTVNLLECVRKYGAGSVLNVTTDKVYENLEQSGGYVETDRLDGYDPYSNSKSCSELVTHSYKKSYFDAAGIPVSTARAGNVIGGGDFAADRIIPDCVRAALRGEDIVIRNPYAVRPFQLVLEPLGAYLLILEKTAQDKSKAGAYNVGPDRKDCIDVGRLADIFCSTWGEGIGWVNRHDGGPHEAGLLMLDCTKIKQELGWKPVYTIAQAVQRTVEFSRTYAQGRDVPAEMDRQIKDYLSLCVQQRQ